MFATSDSGPLLFQLAVSVKRGQRCFEVLTAAMSASRITSNLLVAKAGLEPARPQRHLILSQARLPIPSPGQMAVFISWFRKPDSYNAFKGRALPLRQHHRVMVWLRHNHQPNARVFVSVPRRTGNSITSSPPNVRFSALSANYFSLLSVSFEAKPRGEKSEQTL